VANGPIFMVVNFTENRLLFLSSAYHVLKQGHIKLISVFVKAVETLVQTSD
jgi:hypothetical protein